MRLLLLLASVLLPSLAFAERPPLIPPPPEISAKSYLLLDYDSNQVLISRNADERVEPASLTKLMTAYLTFSALQQKQLALTQTLPVSVHAWRAGGSRMFIQPNKPVAVDDLLKGLIVQSGNDAAIALAEGIAGSEDVFAQMMNREAQRLGMKNTHYADATGLPNPQHYSTAYDLSILTRAIIHDFPEYYSLFAIKEFRYDNISQDNRNRLLWSDPTVDGLKTGHTESAGYCLISSAKRGSRRLIAVVMGEPTDEGRTIDSQKLLNYGFQFYDTVRLYQKGQVVSQLPVWKGSERTVKAGFQQDLFISLPKGESSRLKANLESQQPLLAPVSVGQKVGMMKLTLDGKPLAQYPVVALESVGIGNILTRSWDALRLLFR